MLDVMPYVLRLLQLVAGNLIQGISVAVLVQANLGLPGWDVFHQGLARSVGRPLGSVTVVVSLLLLLLWIPLRVRPGIGTIINAVLVGVFIDVGLAVLPEFDGLWARSSAMVAGTVMFALGTALYIGAELGPGPRDGLMTGIARRGPSVRMARTSIEVAALVAGFLLGGTLGAGTVLFAFGVGPLVQWFLPLFAHPRWSQHAGTPSS